MAYPSLFARKEPTTDELSLKAGLHFRQDVVAYKDRDCTQRVARWGWFQTTRPRDQQPSTMFNCARWKIEWLDPVAGVAK